MKISFKNTTLIIYCICLVVLSRNLFSQTVPEKKVITGEEIRQAGLIRLNELFFLIDDWQGASVDGFDWRMSANALGCIQNQNWIIMLNGQRIPLELLHSNNINFLPVSIEQIDSAVVISIPQVIDNEFSDRGIIHLYSTQKDSGLAIHARMALGNETGDPGPYRYTPYKTPNVDRVAHDESFGISYARWNLHLGLHQKNLVHYPTSEPMLNRVWHPLIGNDYPRIDVNSTFFDGRYKKQKWQIGYTYNRDHLFVKAMGREIPVRRTLYFGSVNGALTQNIKYSLFYQNSYLFERTNIYNLNFDRRIQFIQAQLSSRFNKTFLGLDIQRQVFTSRYLSDEKSLDMLRFSLSNTMSLTSRIKQSISSQILANKNFVTLKAALSHTFLLHKIYTVNSTLAYSERHQEEGDDYFGLPPGWIDTSRINDNKKNRLMTVDLYNNLDIIPGLRIKIGLKYRKFLSSIIEEQIFHYQWFSYDFTGPLTFNTQSSGENAALSVYLKQIWSSRLTQEIFYQNRFYNRGDDQYLNTWSTLARQKASLTISFLPFVNSSIWTKITWLSQTRWPDYRNIPQESEFKYDYITSEIFNWDLALQKSIWRKRLRGSMVFRNLLNRKHVYHPVGAIYNLRFFVQLELDVNSLFVMNHQGTKTQKN